MLLVKFCHKLLKDRIERNGSATVSITPEYIVHTSFNTIIYVIYIYVRAMDTVLFYCGKPFADLLLNLPIIYELSFENIKS